MRSKGPHSRGSGSSGSNLYGVTLAPKRLIFYLSVIIVLLLSCHVGLTIYHYQIEELPWLPWRQLFYVDEENNLPTWFSGFLLSIVAACVWLCARRKRSDRDSWQVHWYALAFGFLLLSLDEIAGLHETINSLIDMNWAIPGGILTVGIGLSFVQFLRKLPFSTGMLFLVSGALYVGGAVGMELVGAPIDADTLSYNLITAVEEGLEMAGALLFLYSLLRYMQTPGGGVIQASVELK